MTSFFAEPHEQPAAATQSPESGANGPVGRLVGTALMMVMGAWLVWANPLGAELWWFVATSGVLRDLWRPGRR